MIFLSTGTFKTLKVKMIESERKHEKRILSFVGCIWLVKKISYEKQLIEMFFFLFHEIG